MQYNYLFNIKKYKLKIIMLIMDRHSSGEEEPLLRA